MGETYYDVLEVDPDATREEIQTAYRERVLETHPDHNDAPDAAEQFKRVSTAKSVLTDGAERARYDRLGHESYVRLAEHSAGEGGAGDSSASADESNTSRSASSRSTTGDSSDDATGTGTASNAGSGSGPGRGTSTGASSRTGTGRRRGSGRDAAGASRSGSQRDTRTESHHARQRKRRRQQRTRQRATSGWSFGSETTASQTSSGDGATATASAAERDAGASEFQYAVHDWTDDVDLEWEGQSLAYSTAVTIGCCWLLYPVFVAAMLTPVFSIAVSAIVGACTLGLVGYLLTRPRVAAVVFGSWSVLFPIGIDWLAPVSQFSLVGLVALGFAWIPFGYALALWWALRP